MQSWWETRSPTQIHTYADRHCSHKGPPTIADGPFSEAVLSLSLSFSLYQSHFCLSTFLFSSLRPSVAIKLPLPISFLSLHLSIFTLSFGTYLPLHKFSLSFSSVISLCRYDVYFQGCVLFLWEITWVDKATSSALPWCYASVCVPSGLTNITSVWVLHMCNQVDTVGR